MNKRTAYILLPLLLLLCSCTARYKEIEPTSFEVVSITPVGLTSLEAVVDVGVHNPAGRLTLSGIGCTVKYKGEDCVGITADPVTLERRCDSVYRVPLKGSLVQGFNPFQLLEILGNQENIEFLTVDVSARAELPGGIGKEIEYSDVPLKRLVDKL